MTAGLIELNLSMNQQVLYDQKWLKFLDRTWLFRYIPFVEFALAAGSMALGNVRSESDFDVIIGAKYGRIFTTRFFCILFFGLLGWRRKKWHSRESNVKSQLSNVKDKICLNHFVTEKSYRLSPPHDAYWQNLYQHLVPIFGPVDQINRFFAANQDWLEKKRIYRDDLRHEYKQPSSFKLFLEKFLDSKIGDWLESILKRIQISRIKSGMIHDKTGYKSRMIYNDNELEFHPDTRRIEEWLRRN